MSRIDIAKSRLANQRIAHTDSTLPAELVCWLGAVQSQDYAGAKWALGLRALNLTDAAVQRAFDDGAILRTHVLRPTWHFVTPDDIGWMLMLTAPRVLAITAHYYRQVDLDDATLARAADVIRLALDDGKHLTRTELGAMLQQAGIDTGELLQLGHIMGYAELTGIVCSGAMRGKQHTYALLADRAPQARTLTRDEALAELTLRYFRSHGPATIKDYVWWSGLTTADARAGIDALSDQLLHEDIGGTTYWFADAAATSQPSSLRAHLLPNYDELVVGYTDRSAIYDNEAHTDKLDARGNALFNYTILMGGQIAGTWKRTLKKTSVRIETTPFRPFTDSELRAFAAAAQQYADFLGLALEIA